MPRAKRPYAEPSHAGAGTVLLLGYVALIPGVVPTLALLGVITAVVVAPVIVLGLAAALLLTPPLIVWRLATRSRRAQRTR